MKKSRSDAIRWLKQATHDLEIAQKHLTDQYYSDACFMAEQTGQKALKAYLFSQGERFVSEHSLVALVQKCRGHDQNFETLVEGCRLLDRYYIPTRYPDAWPEPAAPFEGYGKKEAEDSVKVAKDIVALVRTQIGE